MKRADAERLADIVEAIDRIDGHRASAIPPAVRRDAILYALMVIGEAANHLSPETRAKAPEVPWKLIVGMRNRLVHDYFGVDPQVVDAVVTNRLGALRTAVERLRQS